MSKLYFLDTANPSAVPARVVVDGGQGNLDLDLMAPYLVDMEHTNVPVVGTRDLPPVAKPKTLPFASSSTEVTLTITT